MKVFFKKIISVGMIGMGVAFAASANASVALTEFLGAESGKFSELVKSIGLTD